MRYIYFALIALFIFASSNLSAQIDFKAYIGDDAETIKFINLTSHDSNNPYILFYWHMGDGIEQFAGNELIHYYEAPGEYKISLIGIAKNGVRDTLQRTLVIPDDLEFLTAEGERKQKNVAQNLTNLKSLNSTNKENIKL